MRPKVIIPTGLGINSHEELGYCFDKLGGADVEYRHLNDLIAEPSLIDDYQGAGLPGGFTMGDQLGAGQSIKNRVEASGLRGKLYEKLHDESFPIYCVCNWLQVLAKLDLFPIPVGTMQNDSGKHETSFWDTKVNPKNDNVWLSYLKMYEDPIFAPISHGEGRITIRKDLLEVVKERNLVALTYEKGHMCDFYKSSKGDRYNPNGSTADIAGFGWDNNLVLFPHFERLHHDFQRPDRAAVKREKETTSGVYEPTCLMFKAAVDAMK
ncbi:phosphoribosylformylglycinamidine synthase subunit PurQ [Candidatus Woesearchaeota archaeon]|nr:phosphoribosylformylglycinamidine synthase subunit PurQ [Candidatus Woesearchaeota archaeon]